MTTLNWPQLKISSDLITFDGIKNLLFKSNNKTINKKPIGQVYLIGAGPGDPELLTLKAYRLLQEADIIFYDSLITDEMLQLIPNKTEKIFVGKRCGKHSMKQQNICDLLVNAGLSGKNIVRLKGGDPSIFGRLAEEADALKTHNIKFAVVPGVTAASGCAAYSGIPLTHREYSQSVRFVTAHLKQDELQADWSNLASSKDTLVFYMGLNRINQISEGLIKFGMQNDMPIAIIDKGATNQQQVIISTLKDITHTMKGLKLLGPALIVVGKVINARQIVDLEMLKMSEVENESS
ncbi:uroporphyrinogen-III C-methyltransferase [Pseudoalteromonas sp. NBT06-2]|uniref:uroporphyrinogen-III C-methyltransferase n=1 Tax=Pseudoalteromonas sp. NBT06-2 TaxID=2025950 RepID=UPI000BA57CB0|nr:uroporphyrinogen-III C-methyltransferase [Pseudoalteromonas sp. NBT06-2]PAJ73022.1 uroporphyrinogen-III C-methyltransferase [Pseudoalteromonas sp. NBT06-2]